MRRDNLDVLDLSFTVGTFVFNPHVGKMDVAVNDRKVAPCRPFRNVSRGVVGVPLGPTAIAIQLAEKSLIVAFEFVVENDPVYACALVSKALGGGKIRAI